MLKVCLRNFILLLLTVSFDTFKCGVNFFTCGITLKTYKSFLHSIYRILR
jgi:hypothetical protein